VVYTGTHDNDTTKGWYAKLPAAQREVLQRKLGVDDREIVWAIIRQALASPADIAIVPAQDLLELGTEARMNVPGIAKGNWGWRLKDGALGHEIAEELRGISIEFGRIGDFNYNSVSRSRENDLRPQIAKRAYELYERGGRQNGQSARDWLRAEREVTMETDGENTP
jgi:hypothetical protein